jgi:hypothetical protein
MSSFYRLKIRWLGVNPEVTGAPRQRLSGQILVNQKLADDPSGRWILLTPLIIGQPGPQLNCFSLSPAIGGSGIGTSGPTKDCNFS